VGIFKQFIMQFLLEYKEFKELFILFLLSLNASLYLYRFTKFGLFCSSTSTTITYKRNFFSLGLANMTGVTNYLSAVLTLICPVNDHRSAQMPL
jgi:hypothetical protein